MLYISFNESPIFLAVFKTLCQKFYIVFLWFSGQFCENSKSYLHMYSSTESLTSFFFPYDVFLLRHKAFSNGNIYMHIYMYMY